MRRLAALFVAATVFAACSGGDGDAGGSKLDVGKAQASFGQVVRADGDVIAVSPEGFVLVQRDAQLCTVQLDGTQQGCFDVPDALPSFRGSSFSPDGSKFAFDGAPQAQVSKDSDVSVLDLKSGKVTTLDDDGTDDTSGPQDFDPQWVDDTTVAFLRVTGDEPVQIVRVAIGENKPDARVIDGVQKEEVLRATSTWVAGAYTLALVEDTDEDTTLMQVGKDGRTSVLGHAAGQGGAFGPPSSDRSRGVFLGDLQRMRDITTTVIDGEKTSTIDVMAGSAAVSPDGSIIATLGGQQGLALHSFDGKDARTLDPGEGQARVGGYSMVWAGADQLVLADPQEWQVVTVRNG